MKMRRSDLTRLYAIRGSMWYWGNQMIRANVRRAASKALYAASPKGRATAARYAASAKGHARSSWYNRSLKGRLRSIRHNSTPKGRARRARFEATPHRREYKALAYIFGSPYRDLTVTSVLAVNRALSSWGAEALKGLKFKRVPTRCPHCVAQGRKNLLPMGSRLIPIRRAVATLPLAGWEIRRRASR